MAAVKDAFYPFDATLHWMSEHWWSFPLGWGLTIVSHLLIADRELAEQRRKLEKVRQGSGK